APDGDDVGIALEQIHAIEGDAKPIRDELCEARAVSLSARQGSDRHVDTTFGEHRDLRPFPRCPGGELDVIGDSDAAAFSAAGRGAAPLREVVPASGAGRPSKRRRVWAA